MAAAPFFDTPILEGTKRCRICGAFKPLSEFARHPATRDRHKHECLECARVDGRRRDRLRVPRMYGITSERYQVMHDAQQGVCAICDEPEHETSKTGYVKSLAIDHDKGTGTVRGLLCTKCNQGIGNFRHDPARLRAAIAYLEHHSTS